MTSVPFWSRVAPQALTLLHFGVQQVSTGVCRCPLQDIKEAPGQKPGVCGVDLCRGIGRLHLHKADQSFWNWTKSETRESEWCVRCLTELKRQTKPSELSELKTNRKKNSVLNK